MDDSFTVELRVFGFEDKKSADEYAKDLMSACFNVPKNEQLNATVCVVSAQELRDEINTIYLQARAIRALTEKG